MKSWAPKFRLPPAKPNEQNPFIGHYPSRICRYLTLWWWEQGPITKLPQGRVAFWERLNIKAPRHAKPYCYLVNKVKFASRKHGQGMCYGECEHYHFNTLSSTLLGDPRDGTWWEVNIAWIKYRHGYWWAVFEGRNNTTLASMVNKMWANR